jgi:Domain of unknown function (DUF1707)
VREDPQAVGATPTDEDRKRYLRLLDSAFSRELLDHFEYNRRATEIQSAGTIDQMNAIVQNLPLLEKPAAPVRSRSSAMRQPVASEIARATAPGIALSPLTGSGVHQDATRTVDEAYRSSTSTHWATLTSLGVESEIDVRDVIDPVTGEPIALDPVDLARLANGRNGNNGGASANANQSRRFGALVVVAIMFLVLMVLGLVLAAHSHATSHDGLAALRTVRSTVPFARTSPVVSWFSQIV